VFFHFRFQVRRVTFLNGGMRYRHANLRLSQQILLSPLGSWFSKLPIETFFKKQIRTLFANQSAISDEELDQWFNLMGYNHGLQNMHRLIEYIRDRHRFEPRWTRALQATSVPIRLIWGSIGCGCSVGDCARSSPAGAKSNVDHNRCWTLAFCGEAGRVYRCVFEQVK
jgi:hypothetical protein